MSDASPLLALPYILPAQAQKHVTHNEAIRALDALVQLAVADRTRTAPPAEPAEGDRHIVATGATGAWAGQDGKVALWAADAGWLFLAPRPGWLAWVAAEGRLLVRGAAAWQEVVGGAQSFDRVGISAAADDTNRLALSSPASLFGHAGAGHQLKINKALDADTASLLFQTGFSGRAEMGTAGSDDFAVKVSPDGSAWHEAVAIDRASGRTTLAAGLRLPAGSVSAPALGGVGHPTSGLYFPAASQVALAAGGVQALLASTTALTAPLPVLIPDGTAAAPGLAFSAGTGTGLHRPAANVLAFATGGAERARINGTGRLMVGYATAPTGISSGIGAHSASGSLAGISAYSVSDTATTPAILFLARARGTDVTAAPLVSGGDFIGDIRFMGGDGTQVQTCAAIRAYAAGTPAAGDVPGDLRFLTRPQGGGLMERARLTAAGNLGLNTTDPTATLHVNGPVRVGSYTVATVPSASAAGAGSIIYVSNETGGAVLAFSDGTSWRRVTDRAVVS